MSKNKADDTNKISISFLKKYDYFTGWMSGTITWTRNGWGGESKSSVGLEASTMHDDKYLRIHYTQTDRNTQAEKDFDYKIPLTTTHCRYGGVRYWFTCPWYKNGVYCGRRVAKLYKDGDYFACRHCYNLTYESRNAKKSYKKGVFGILGKHWKSGDYLATLKRTYYNGKPTRKYRRYLKMSHISDEEVLAMERDKHFARSFTKHKK